MGNRINSFGVLGMSDERPIVTKKGGMGGWGGLKNAGRKGVAIKVTRSIAEGEYQPFVGEISERLPAQKNGVSNGKVGRALAQQSLPIFH